MVVTKFKQRYPRNDNAKRDCCTKQEQNTPPITPLSKSCNSSSILSRDGTKKKKKKEIRRPRHLGCRRDVVI